MIPALENAAVNVIDYYLNVDATSICVAAEITLPVANATLRVEVVPALVELEVAVPRLSPAVR